MDFKEEQKKSSLVFVSSLVPLRYKNNTTLKHKVPRPPPSMLFADRGPDRPSRHFYLEEETQIWQLRNIGIDSWSIDYACRQL
jgi:hypothetical protein